MTTTTKSGAGISRYLRVYRVLSQALAERRFGAGEPHSRAEMMEFNYLAEQGAIVRTSEGR